MSELKDVGGGEGISALFDTLFGSSGTAQGEQTTKSSAIAKLNEMLQQQQSTNERTQSQQESSERSKSTATTQESQQKEGSEVEQFTVDQAAIDKVVEDILAGDSGLAKLFSEENEVGIYNSTVAKQGSQDLIAAIAGEVAKLTGRTTRSYGENVGVTGSEFIDSSAIASLAQQQNTASTTKSLSDKRQVQQQAGNQDTTSKQSEESDGLFDMLFG